MKKTQENNKYHFFYQQEDECYYIQLYFQNPKIKIQTQNLNTTIPKFWKADFDYQNLVNSLEIFSDCKSAEDVFSNFANFLENKNMRIDRHNDGNFGLILNPSQNSQEILLKRIVLSNNSSQVSKVYEDNMKSVELELEKQRNDINEIKLSNQFLKEQTMRINEDIFLVKKQNETLSSINKSLIDMNAFLKENLQKSNSVIECNRKELNIIKSSLNNMISVLHDSINPNSRMMSNPTSYRSNEHNRISEPNQFSYIGSSGSDFRSNNDLERSSEINPIKCNNMQVNISSNSNNSKSIDDYNSKILRTNGIKIENPSTISKLKEEHKLDQPPLESYLRSSEIENCDGELFNTPIISLIREYINEYSTFNYKLIYKSSVHGDKAKIFHMIMNESNKPSLVIIKTDTNEIFGGYTEKSWECTSDAYKEDERAFIFNSKTVFTVSDSSKAIKCCDNLGPCFGEDIILKDNFCSDNKNIIGFPNCYGNKNSKNTFNEGKRFFKVKDIEVYKITILMSSCSYNL